MSKSEDTAADEDLEAFHRAACRLIVKNKSPLEWSEDETIAMRLITQIGTLYRYRPDPSAVAAMGRALAQFRGDTSQRDRRAHCVDVIADWGSKWRQPEWQASPETRGLLLRQCARELMWWEPAFEWLLSEPEALIEVLVSYDPRPRGKTGARSAEGVLAELVSDRDALGFRMREGEDLDDYRERVRRKLADDRRSCGW